MRPRGAARLAALSTAVFLAAALFRSPSVLLAPRFWAEEGFVYYQYMQHTSAWDGLLFVYNGNYQLLTNLFCLVAARVPERFAASTTAYLGTLVDLGCAFLFAEALRARGAALGTVAAGVALWALQHGGYEVLLNTTNVMWVCSTGALWIALGPERRAAAPRALADYAAVLCFGLTGLTSVALAPVFAVQALRGRSRHRAILLAVLLAAGAVQAAVVWHEGVDPDRAGRLSGEAVAPIVLQTELATFVPSEALDALGARIRPYDAPGTGIAVQVGLIGAALLALFGAGGPAGPARVDRLVIAAALVGVSAFDEFGARGAASAWHSGWEGGRYFFLGNTCFIALVCLSGAGAPPFRRRLAAAALALALANAAVQRFTAGWTAIFTAGPSLSSQLRACAGRRPCTVVYPPRGPGAEFPMDRTFLPGYELPPG